MRACDVRSLLAAAGLSLSVVGVLTASSKLPLASSTSVLVGTLAVVAVVYASASGPFDTVWASSSCWEGDETTNHTRRKVMSAVRIRARSPAFMTPFDYIDKSIEESLL